MGAGLHPIVVGPEAHLYSNWTGKVEYLFMNLGSMTTNINNQGAMTLTAMFNNYKFD